LSAWRLSGILLVVGAMGLGAAQGIEQDRRGLATITDSRVDEASGMVLSTRLPGHVYVINDSGNDPMVFVVEVATGAVVGSTALSGVELLDSEALTITPDDQLLVADIGDNGEDRDEVALLTIEQPGLGDATAEPTVDRVRYADGPADAEGVLIEPGTGRILIATKGIFAGGRVLALPASLRDQELSVARPLDVETPALVTDAATLPDGSGAVLRTYGSVYIYQLPGWEMVHEDDLPRTQQGETLAVYPTGMAALVGSEGSPSPLIRVQLPDVTEPRADPSAEPSDPTPTPTGSAQNPRDTARADEGVDGGADAGADGGDAAGSGWPLRAAGGAGVVALLLGGALLLYRRRQLRTSSTR
jgi:hypothetical protein